MKKERRLDDLAETGHACLLEFGRKPFFYPTFAQAAQKPWEWHLYGANVPACATKGGCVQKRVSPLHSIQQSCQHDSHGSWIGRAVSMAPNHAVHGAGVQAGAAPNALKHFAVF